MKKTLSVAMMLFLRLSLHAQSAPFITTQPTNQTALAGATVSFAVVVSGAGPFTYQWKFNGNHLPAGVGGVIFTVAGNGNPAYSGDGASAANASLNNPSGVALDSLGNLFIADTGNNVIRKVDTNGVITTVAGNGTGGYSGDGGPATNASLRGPSGLTLDAGGGLFIADYANARIRKLNTNGLITLVAGGGTNYPGDGEAATNASLRHPVGVAVDAAGNILIADLQDTDSIRKVDTNGIISTFATSILRLSGLTFDTHGDLFISEFRDPGLILELGPDGVITTLAGGGQMRVDTGPAANADLDDPAGVVVDAVGNLFLADGARVRGIDTNGILFTVAGTGEAGYAGDGGAATNALVSYASGPSGLALAADGDIIFADPGNNRIRAVRPGGLPALTLDGIKLPDQGNYQVLVTSPYGSVTSIVAALTVVLAPSLKATLGPGTSLILVASNGSPGQSYILESANSLVPPVIWQPVATNLADSGGNWSFTNATISSQGALFYRVAAP